MPGSTGPNLGLVWGYSDHDNGWGSGSYNPGFAKLDTLVHLAVLDITNTPPGSPVDGDRYICGNVPTGAWSGHPGEVAVYLAIGGPAWVFYSPKAGWRAWSAATENRYLFDGTNWRSATRYAIGAQSDPGSTLSADQDLLYHRFVVDVSFPADFGSFGPWQSQAGGTAAATGDTVIAVAKAADADPLSFSDVATITIGASGVDATFDSSATVLDFDKGDVLRLRAPATPDLTFKGFYATLVGYVR